MISFNEVGIYNYFPRRRNNYIPLENIHAFDVMVIHNKTSIPIC